MSHCSFGKKTVAIYFIRFIQYQRKETDLLFALNKDDKIFNLALNLGIVGINSASQEQVFFFTNDFHPHIPFINI